MADVTKTPEEIAAQKAADEAGSKTDDVVEMSKAKIQELYDDAFAKGARNGADPKALKAAEAEKATLQSQLDELQKKMAAAAAGPDGGKKTGAQADLDQVVREQQSKIEQLTKSFGEQIEALQSATESERQKREASENALAVEGLKNIVLRAAGELNVHDPSMVFTLMDAAGIFKKEADSGSFMVIDPSTGKLRIDVSAEAAGQPLSIDAVTREFVNQRQFLVKSSGRTGSGQGTVQGSGSGNTDQGNLPTPPAGVDPMNLKPSQVAQHGVWLRQFKAAGGEIHVQNSHHNS